MSQTHNVAFYCLDSKCMQRLAMIQDNYVQECCFCGQRWPMSSLTGKYIEPDIAFLNESEIRNHFNEE